MTSHQNQFNGPRRDPNHTLLLSISSDKQLSIWSPVSSPRTLDRSNATQVSCPTSSRKFSCLLQFLRTLNVQTTSPLASNLL
jgi:hypothetical protein